MDALLETWRQVGRPWRAFAMAFCAVLAVCVLGGLADTHLPHSLAGAMAWGSVAAGLIHVRDRLWNAPGS